MPRSISPDEIDLTARPTTATNWFTLLLFFGGFVACAAVTVFVFIRFELYELLDESPNLRAREQAERIGSAIKSYVRATRRWPASKSTDAIGKPLLSWRVHLLPHIGQQELYEKFQLSEPWDSPHNSALIASMPGVYRNKGFRLESGRTCWLAIIGPDSVITREPIRDGKMAAGIRPKMITDNRNLTMVVVETDPPGVIWTQPSDYEYSDDNLPRPFGNSRDNHSLFAINAEGLHVSLSNEFDDTSLRSLFTRSRGEQVDVIQKQVEDRRR